MSVKGLATVTLQVNDETVLYKPDSLEFSDGFGEMVVRFQTSGGGGGETVFTEKAETKYAYVKVTLLTTAANIEKTRQWLTSSRQANGNVVNLSGGVARSFQKMRITEEPKFGVGSEGEFEIMFQGEKAA